MTVENGDPAPRDGGVGSPVEEHIAHLEIEGLERRAREEAKRLEDEAREALRLLREQITTDPIEAARRFRAWQRRDPFPGVLPGLLSCSEFCGYIAEAGILCPYKPDILSVQIASLDLPLLGLAVWVDEHGEQQQQDIRRNEPFHLRPNSIAFVTLEPYLRLPDYIAMRFNLRVRHVYKGLLLGTGPIIDPGYQGYLSIPLHNLTDNSYTFRGGDNLIAVEFTKLDPSAVSVGRQDTNPTAGGNRPPTFSIPFREPDPPDPNSNWDHPIYRNFTKAEVEKVASSLPKLAEAVDRKGREIEARLAAETSGIAERLDTQEKKVDDWTRLVTFGGALALIALLFTVGGIMWQATSEMRSIASREQGTFERTEIQRRILADSLASFRSRLQATEQVLCIREQADTSRQRAAAVAAICRDSTR
jgi:deoxycytidine triphosphate deaminase